MGDRLLGAEQVTPRNGCVIGIGIAAIARQVTVAIGPVMGRQTIPWQARMHVMDDMQIIVEKQKCQRSAIFDDDAARRCAHMRLMFEKGADLQ